MDSPVSKINEVIRTLYPGLTDAELVEAEANLRRYFKIALAVSEAQTRDGPHPRIDTGDSSSSMEERSNVVLKPQ